VIQFEDIDDRLRSIGKNRAWLAEASGRKINSIRVALAPKADAKNRNEMLQRALSAAIEREEADQALMAQPVPPGMTNVFLSDEMLDRADRASRLVNSPSLADFCREAILFRAGEILAGNHDPVDIPFTAAPAQGPATYRKTRLRVAEDPPAPGKTKDAK